MSDETATKALEQAEESGIVEPTAPPTAEILQRVSRFLRRFISFKLPAQIVAVSLWVAHTYAVEAADATPYLAVTSAEKRSGKTRLLETLEVLVRRPALVAHISSAALYRTIEEETPTLLFDETDAIFHKAAGAQAEALRGILNAGYRRGAAVRICVGEGKKLKVVAFPVFCPKALSGIGNLPDTIADRSIRIRMERRTRTEKVERFRRRLIEDEAEEIREALETWAGSETERLKHVIPALPDALDDRQQEAWEPLLAIADLAGATYPDAARRAALELAEASEQADEDSLGVLLLEHLRDAFEDSERVSTDDLLHALTERDDGPWAEWWGHDVRDGNVKGPAARLSRILKPFEVRPTQFKEDGDKVRGYRREHLEPLWDRYLTPYVKKKVLGTSQAEHVREVPSTEISRDAGGETTAPETTPEIGAPAHHFDQEPMPVAEVATAFNAQNVSELAAESEFSQAWNEARRSAS